MRIGAQYLLFLHHVYAARFVLERVSNFRLTAAQGCVQRKLVRSCKYIANSLNSLHDNSLNRQVLHEDKSGPGIYMGTLKVMICKLLLYFQLNGRENDLLSLGISICIVEGTEFSEFKMLTKAEKP